MYLIHLVYQTSYVSLAYLKCEHDSPKMLATQCTIDYPLFASWLCAWLGAVIRCHCPAASWEGYQYCVLLPQEKMNVYHFHTITKLKYRKSNHHKSGAVCILKKFCFRTYILFLYWKLPLDKGSNFVIPVCHTKPAAEILPSEMALCQ